MTEPHDAVLARLHLQVTRRLDGLLQGDYLGLLPGPGSEAGESREYRPGDDVRRMDWPVTARTTVPHVRLTEADRELETWLAVDGSASLDFGTARMRKWDLAICAAAAMTHLTARGGNRVGAVLATGGRIRPVPARGGRRGAQALLHAIAHLEPRPGRTNLGDLLDTLMRPPRRRGLVVVISDFLGPVGEWQRPLARLGVRHDLLAVEIVDPRELELPPVGFLEVVDPETGDVHEVDVDERLAAAYARAAQEHRSAVATGLRAAGAGRLRLRTDSDWLRDTVNFVAGRRKGRDR
ncbi:DUF58 domain-containing protein [Hamadaea tsunoensis]|uniref:DUF58 domain-containing protein n=1 Tax=Hamadaea tsunoensis TaxID=53368 RepID=UPI0003F6BA5B|nr:DUF58 domain-containing protein [Hamadaea tsunoensis]